MEIIDIRNIHNYLEEYCRLCILEWGSELTDEKVQDKINKVLNGDNVIVVLGLIDNDNMIGFISLFKNDGDERNDLIPWYATMYVKEEFRGKGYSKILNKSILKEAKNLGFDKVYLKTDLNNYYEKYGAKYIETLNNGEKLYYIDIL